MIRTFFSPRTTAVLLIVLAAVLGSITAFEALDAVEGEYRGTYHMYGSWWFALLLGLVFLHLIGSFPTRRMRRRWEYLSLHLGLGLVLVGAFFSWRFAERGMMYLSRGQQSNLIEVSDQLWIERESPDGELTRLALGRSRGSNRYAIHPSDNGADEITLVSILPHALVTHVPQPATTGSGVPAITFDIVTPHGNHELLMAGGFQDEAEVAGLRVVLAPPWIPVDQQPALVVQTQTEKEILPLNLPEDLSAPATNPAVLLGIQTTDGEADTVRVFSRFPGFDRPQVPGLTSITFMMPSRPGRRLHVYLDSLATWRFVFFGDGETVTNTVTQGDTFFVGQGAHLPMVITTLMANAEVIPRVAPSHDGPAAVRLEMDSIDEPVWLVEDGPDVLVPTKDGRNETLRLVHTAPLPFWIRLEEATRSFYANSSIPRVYASSVRTGTSPEFYGPAQIVETNAPLSSEGWRAYQSEYGDHDGQPWSGLLLAKDPGAPMAGAGVLVLLLGILVRAGRRR
jgi:hypothetical protein